MRIRSRFIESELLFWREGCEVIDRGDHLSVKCHANPNWRWGNLIIADRAPQQGDLAKWNSAFEEAFPEGRPHRMYAWDDPAGNAGESQEFLDAGFRLQHDTVLSASRLVAPARSELTLTFRQPNDDDDWESIIRSNAMAFAPDTPNYEKFIRGLLSIHRSLIAKGQGFWVCAYVNGELAASCGIFKSKNFSRYQEVGVTERFRNKGVASNLVYHTSQLATERAYPTPFYMVADTGSRAERLYERLGFTPIEITSSLRRIPEDEQKKDT